MDKNSLLSTFIVSWLCLPEHVGTIWPQPTCNADDYTVRHAGNGPCIMFIIALIANLNMMDHKKTELRAPFHNYDVIGRFDQFYLPFCTPVRCYFQTEPARAHSAFVYSESILDALGLQLAVDV